MKTRTIEAIDAEESCRLTPFVVNRIRNRYVQDVQIVRKECKSIRKWIDQIEVGDKKKGAASKVQASLGRVERAIGGLHAQQTQCERMWKKRCKIARGVRMKRMSSTTTTTTTSNIEVENSPAETPIVDRIRARLSAAQGSGIEDARVRSVCKKLIRLNRLLATYQDSLVESRTKTLKIERIEKAKAALACEPLDDSSVSSEPLLPKPMPLAGLLFPPTTHTKHYDGCGCLPPVPSLFEMARRRKAFREAKKAREGSSGS